MGARRPELIDHRVKKKNRAAILFIHGFGGDAAATWDRFPRFLAADDKLHGWDVLSLGYHSRLRVDLVGLWNADPQSAKHSWLDSARLAAESREFKKAGELLEPNKDDLDLDGLVELALALEGVGRQEDAIRMLEEQERRSTDAMGLLAGRLKRRWLATRRRSDADKAVGLCGEAYAMSVAANEHPQARYHGINFAFMNLAFKNDKQAARRIAKEVLTHCQIGKEKGQRRWRGKKDDLWRMATEGEAYLLLGKPSIAIELYCKVVEFTPAPKPRELDSMYQQAIHVVGLTGGEQTARRLDDVFKGDDR